jgi:hypothetical protein
MEAEMLSVFLGIYLIGSILSGILCWMILVAAKRPDRENGFDVE